VSPEYDCCRETGRQTDMKVDMDGHRNTFTTELLRLIQSLTKTTTSSQASAQIISGNLNKLLLVVLQTFSNYNKTFIDHRKSIVELKYL
jgi:hypothetical protein